MAGQTLPTRFIMGALELEWKRELVIAHLVKQKIAEVDVNELWESTLPGVAASEEQIRTLEARMGGPLDPQHKEFLLHANGWRAFMQSIDVFSLDDFLDGARAQRAVDLVESLEPLDVVCGLGKHELLPIAVSSDDIDVMLMAKPETECAGKIFWFAGGLIETFVGFDEWFLAMVDYNRAEYRRLLSSLPKQ